MANGRVISVRFRISDDGRGFRRLTADADSLRATILGMDSPRQRLNRTAINLTSDGFPRWRWLSPL